MKKSLIVLTLSVISSAVFATSGKALITKSNFPGHVHPDYRLIETCEVLPHQVRITKRLGGGENTVISTEVRNASISGDVKALIEKAAADPLAEKPNSMCDGPGTKISAGQDDVLLFTTGGCGQPSKERQGGNAFLLRSIVDAYCPVTHQGGGEG